MYICMHVHTPTRLMMARAQFHLPADTGDPGVRDHSLVDLRWRRRCSIEPLLKNGTEPSKHGICLVIWFVQRVLKQQLVVAIVDAEFGLCCIALIMQRCWVVAILHVPVLARPAHICLAHMIADPKQEWSWLPMAHAVFSQVFVSTRRTQKHVFPNASGLDMMKHVQALHSQDSQRSQVTRVNPIWLPQKSDSHPLLLWMVSPSGWT